MSTQKWRIGLTVLLIVVAIIASWDTFTIWTMSDEQKAAMQEDQPGEFLQLQQKAIRLGLDLQGGIHVVLRVKTEDLPDVEDVRSGAVDRAIQIIRTRVDGLGVAEPIIQKQGHDRIIVDMPGYTDADRAEDLIGQTALLEFKLLASMDDAALILSRIDSTVYAYETAQAGETETEAAVEEAATEAAEETDTTAESSDDVLAELMGDSAVDTSAFEFDETLDVADNPQPFSSLLEPFLFRTQSASQWPGFSVHKKNKQKIDRWLNLPDVRAVIPIEVQFSWSTRLDIRDQREVYELYLLKRKTEFVGKYLESISLGQKGDGTGGYAVDFQVSGDGAARFAQLTGANIGKPLAVVIDDRVESAPFIESKIRTNGQITMGGRASIKEARNLEIVLEAGALPAEVEIIEKNVVGATLGADSIRKGFYSSLFGLALVLLYIAVYYRLSGVIADVGLMFNIFFLLAAMAGLGATLTMPGIAGIILTIGISVDANILIFERIREELRSGKTVRASIDAGYERAFVAIFDSHVTTLITAGALFLLGSGSIKGFAVTLFWGVAISLYTAYVITKAIFDIRKGYRSLSI